MRDFIKKNRIYIGIGTSIAVVAAVVASGAFSGTGTKAPAVVPQEFLEARARAATISEEIVALTRESSDSLGKISDADSAGRYSEGLNLVLVEVGRNSVIREKAVDLSEELKNMAVSLEGVSPDEAAQVGLRAVTSGLEMVQRLVNYNNYTYDLLNALQARLGANNAQEKRANIESAIEKMNQEAAKINELNAEYNRLMEEFDKLTS